MSKPRILLTRQEMADYCRCSPVTITRWIAEQSFPAAYLPNRKLATSTTLVDCWLQARCNVAQAKRHAARSNESAAKR